MKWAGLETPKCVTVHQRVNRRTNSRDTYQIYHTHELESYKNCWKMDSKHRNHYLADIAGGNIKHIGKVDCSSNSYNEQRMSISICNKKATITVLASELGGCG